MGGFEIYQEEQSECGLGKRVLSQGKSASEALTALPLESSVGVLLRTARTYQNEEKIEPQLRGLPSYQRGGGEGGRNLRWGCLSIGPRKNQRNLLFRANPPFWSRWRVGVGEVGRMGLSIVRGEFLDKRGQLKVGSWVWRLRKKPKTPSPERLVNHYHRGKVCPPKRGGFSSMGNQLARAVHSKLKQQNLL